MLPDETWIASAPASSSQRQTWTESSIVFPAPSQGRKAFACSVVETFTWTWKSCPTSARIALTVSSSSRARFSSGPPYSSSRSLMAEERNCVNR